MKKGFPISVFMLWSIVTLGQQTLDKLHLNDEVKLVKIEEVGTNTIKYSHENENTSYVISKNLVQKIEFASGREEIFQSPFKPVNSIHDYENVYISYLPQDVDGIRPMGEVYSKATGVTALASINNVKNRAVKKIKMEAAMLGANIILVGDTYQRGNQYGNEYTPANATMTSISGTAYSTEKRDLTALKSKIENYQYLYYHYSRLNRNAWNVNDTYPETHDTGGNLKLLKIDSVVERDGELFVRIKELKTKSPELKVINADEKTLILMERDGKTIHNHLLLSENDPRVMNGIKIMNARNPK